MFFYGYTVCICLSLCAYKHIVIGETDVCLAVCADNKKKKNCQMSGLLFPDIIAIWQPLLCYVTLNQRFNSSLPYSRNITNNITWLILFNQTPPQSVSCISTICFLCYHSETGIVKSSKKLSFCRNVVEKWYWEGWSNQCCWHKNKNNVKKT